MSPAFPVAILLLLSTACNQRPESLPPPYDTLPVPRSRLASAEAHDRGRRLFLEHCALCHGVKADGQGVRRTGLTTRPRDFTDPSWHRRTSPRRVFYVVREGVRGTAMASWRSLTDEQVWDIVAFLTSLPAVASPSPS